MSSCKQGVMMFIFEHLVLDIGEVSSLQSPAQTYSAIDAEMPNFSGGAVISANGQLAGMHTCSIWHGPTDMSLAEDIEVRSRCMRMPCQAAHIQSRLQQVI